MRTDCPLPTYEEEEGEDEPNSKEDKGTKKCPNCGSDLYEYCFMCCYEGEKVIRNDG